MERQAESGKLRHQIQNYIAEEKDKKQTNERRKEIHFFRDIFIKSLRTTYIASTTPRREKTIMKTDLPLKYFSSIFFPAQTNARIIATI
jgi:hypothetical protein